MSHSPHRMRPGVLVAVCLALLGLATALAVPASAAPAPRYPVSYNFLDGIRAELANPGGSLPGTNDFRCRPTPDHPRPVVLVHGTGGGQQTNWAALAPVLANAGYCVFAPTYGALSTAWPVSALGGLGPKPDSARQVKTFVDRVLAATGARRVDIVGHSQGTEIPTYWVKYLGGRNRVGNYVSLAPYWRQGPDDDDARGEAIATFRRGLGIADPAPCADCTAPPANQSFNEAVRSPSPYVPGIAYTNIVTRYDTIVTPYSAGLLDGPPGTSVRNVVVQQGCSADRSDHLSIVATRRSAALVLGALDPAHAPPVPCLAVPPVTGA